MKLVVAAAFPVITGPGFLFPGFRSLRRAAWRDGVPAAELLIDRLAGVEPPPRTAWDRRFALSNTAMLIMFGSFFSICGVAILYSFVQE